MLRMKKVVSLLIAATVFAVMLVNVMPQNASATFLPIIIKMQKDYEKAKEKGTPSPNGHSTIYVEDQEASIAFRTEKMGFIVHEKHPMGPKANWVEIGPENGQTRLVLYPKAMIPNHHELKPSFIFVCDNIQETYNQLREKGVEFLDEPKEMAWGIFTTFKDVDGNQFLLKQ